MKGFSDILLPDGKLERMQVKVTKKPDGGFNYIGNEVKGYHTNQPIYDDKGKKTMPIVEAQTDNVGELVK